MKTTVWCNTEFIGFHMWPDAPDNYKYLSYPHRHVFKVYTEVIVTHDDRQVEFHALKRDVDFVCVMLRRQMGIAKSWSCEKIATIFLENLKENYNVKTITVSEDGENGATIYVD